MSNMMKDSMIILLNYTKKSDLTKWLTKEELMKGRIQGKAVKPLLNLSQTSSAPTTPTVKETSANYSLPAKNEEAMPPEVEEQGKFLDPIQCSSPFPSDATFSMAVDPLPCSASHSQSVVMEEQTEFNSKSSVSSFSSKNLSSAQGSFPLPSSSSSSAYDPNSYHPVFYLDTRFFAETVNIWYLPRNYLCSRASIDMTLSPHQDRADLCECSKPLSTKLFPETIDKVGLV